MRWGEIKRGAWKLNDVPLIKLGAFKEMSHSWWTRCKRASEVSLFGQRTWKNTCDYEWCSRNFILQVFEDHSFPLQLCARRNLSICLPVLAVTKTLAGASATLLPHGRADIKARTVAQRLPVSHVDCRPQWQFYRASCPNGMSSQARLKTNLCANNFVYSSAKLHHKNGAVLLKAWSWKKCHFA